MFFVFSTFLSKLLMCAWKPQLLKYSNLQPYHSLDCWDNWDIFSPFWCLRWTWTKSAPFGSKSGQVSASRVFLLISGGFSLWTAFSKKLLQCLWWCAKYTRPSQQERTRYDASLWWCQCFYFCHLLYIVMLSYRMRTLWPEMTLRMQTSCESATMAFSCWRSLVSVWWTSGLFLFIYLFF